jgi:hypothetical protein
MVMATALELPFVQYYYGAIHLIVVKCGYYCFNTLILYLKNFSDKELTMYSYKITLFTPQVIGTISPQGMPWLRMVTNLSQQRPGLISMSVHVGYVVDKVAGFSPQYFQVSPVKILPMFPTCISQNYHQCCIILATDSVLNKTPLVSLWTYIIILY